MQVKRPPYRKRPAFETLRKKMARERYVLASRRDPEVMDMLIYEWAEAADRTLDADERRHMIDATLLRQGRKGSLA